MKKRFFAILLCFIAVMTLCVFPLTVSAEEISTETVELVETQTSVVDEPSFEETAPAPAEPAPKAPSASGALTWSFNAMFTRIWEFVRTYSEEVFSVAGSFVLLVLNLMLKHSGSKTSKETKQTLDLISKGVTDTGGSQKSVVEAVNSMIEGYNGLSQRYDDMKESYDAYGATEDERNRIVGAVLATNTAILEILTTVYVNSKNLPQGVKDLVNLKYANCLKTLEDDEKLKAIVEAVRNNIGASSEAPEIGTDATEE